MKFQIVLVVVISSLGIIGCNAELGLVATSVDGKHYYVDPGTSWLTSEKAVEFCKSHGMQLASISSPEDKAALDAAYNKFDTRFSYWIQGNENSKCRYYYNGHPKASQIVGVGCEIMLLTLCQNTLVPRILVNNHE